MPVMPESKFKKEIKQFLKSIGAYYAIIPGGAYGTNGSPDMVVCYKGMFIGIEAKANEGVQSEWQKNHQRQIERAGGHYLLPYDLEQVKQFFLSLDDRD